MKLTFLSLTNFCYIFGISDIGHYGLLNVVKVASFNPSMIDTRFGIKDSDRACQKIKSFPSGRGPAASFIYFVPLTLSNDSFSASCQIPQGQAPAQNPQPMQRSGSTAYS